jgi:hypothetical protein
MVATRSIARSLVLGAAALVCSCTGAQTPPATRTAPPRPSKERTVKTAPASPVANLDLQAMIAPVPEYEGTGRNLFAFGPVRLGAEAQPADTRPVEPTPLVEPPSHPALTPRSLPASSRLDVKYAGFLEKTRPDGAKAKYAIFLDGNEILAGAEGETVGNRFTVVEIGLESVTVSARGTNVTQRIPLQSN